jgi:hypothetical protein
MKRSLALNFLLTYILKRKKLKSIKKEKRKKEKDGLMKTWPIPNHSNIHNFLLGKDFLANF